MRHPTDDDLLAWHLFYLMDSIPKGELDPGLVKGLIDIFRHTPREEIHGDLYACYEEYREQFIR